MKMQVKKTLAAAACAAALGGMTGTAQAANWLMLQGTEPPGQAPRVKMWGFIQAQYQKDFSDPNPAGEYVPPKLIGPDLRSQSSFNVFRARIGARGTGFPLDSKVNYFFLVEFGNNAITAPGAGFAKVTDASITLNHIKGMRIRAGQFKVPMAEELYQGIALFDYIEFTEGTNGLLLERPPNPVFTGNQAPQAIPAPNSFNTYTQSVAAGRDVGVQLFDTFDMGSNWELGYSIHVGNGNGLNTTDNDRHKDLNLYLSLAKVFGGRGPRREDMKFFVWRLDGKRSYDGDNDGVTEEYDRTRQGVGFKYFRKPWRFTAEYFKADGVIFDGPDKASFGFLPPAVGNPSHPANGLNAKADSWYVEGGWYIPGTKWELDARYSELTNLKGGPAEHVFKKLTLGVQYHFNRKTRGTINYDIRDFEATQFASGAGPNANLDGVDDRLGIQVTHIF